MAAIYVLMSLFTWLQSRTMINVAQLTIRNMRKDAFDKLQILPVSFLTPDPGRYHEQINK